PTGPHHDGARGRETCLTLGADLGKDRLACVPIAHGGSDPQAARAALSHSRTRASGFRWRTISVTTAATSAPAANTPGRRSSVRPPTATSGIVAIRRFP